MNNGKKFDVCLLNPPYGSVGGDTLHLKFVDKMLDVADTQVVVMPFGFVTKDTKPFKKYKEKFSKYLTNIEEYPSSAFQGTGFPNVAIHELDINKNDKENINIQYLDGHNDNVNSLLNISKFSDYEKNIVNYLEKNGQQPMSWAGGHDHCTKQSLNKKGIFDIIEINRLINENIKENCEHLQKNKIYLLTNAANGGMNGTFISNKVGIIFTSFNDLVALLIERQTTTAYNVIMFDDITSAKNCKYALMNSNLLRFTCHKMQEDQMMTTKKAYRYVPNIDWEDDRVLTDEGLLEVCGCPKDKAKEYAEYCKKYIEENVDKK